MSNTVTWQPSTDPLIYSYVVQSASVFTGPYTTIATIVHSLTNPAVYNSVLGVFYYVDNAGTLTTWYRLAAVDTLAQQSPWSAPFQPGTNLPATAKPYTTDSLLANAKLRGMIPTASGKTFAPSDFLSFATDEMRTTIVPAIMAERQDYYSSYVDFPANVLDPGDPNGQTLGPFQMPYRAIGSDPKLVQLIDASSRPVEIGRIQPEDLPFHSFGWYFRNNLISVRTNVGSSWKSVRLWFYLRTNQLTTTDQVAYVQTFDANAKTVTLNTVPTSFAAAANYDLLKSQPTFDTLAYDQAATLSGGVLTFSAALPTNLSLGDQVSLADQSAVIQLPVEFHACLAQAVVCRCLEALGDREGLTAAQTKFKSMMEGAVKLIANRAAGNPVVVFNAHAPIRRYY